MRIIMSAVIITMACAVAAPISASEHPAMALVRKNYSGDGAVTASFDLSIYWDVREREEKRSGELLVAPGNRFRVTLGREAFVSDGKTFWQYNERNSQVVIRGSEDIDVGTLPTRILSTFMTGRKFVEQKRGGGTAELLWDGGGKDEMGDGYTKIIATVEEKSGVIRVLKLTDKNSNIHTFTFKKTTFGKPPKDDVFKFAAPKGVEILDMRQQ